MSRNDARPVGHPAEETRQNAGYDEAVRGTASDQQVDLREGWLENHDVGDEDEPADDKRQSER